jgi:hypothetical protein
LLLNRQAAHDRRVAFDGVVVSWHALESPNHPDGDGTAVWLYEITAYNPGRLPIDSVSARVIFPCDVRRLHYDSGLDQASREVTMATPVLAGGYRRTWQRRLCIAYYEKANLTRTHAEISLRDIDNEPHVNPWPRPTGGKLPVHRDGRA